MMLFITCYRSLVKCLQNIKKGSEFSAKAGESIHQIIEFSTKLSDIIDHIAAASNEQTGGLDQINTAISQLDQLTQENASMVQQSNASVLSLQKQSERLIELLDEFKMGSSYGYEKGISAHGSRSGFEGREGALLN